MTTKILDLVIAAVVVFVFLGATVGILISSANDTKNAVTDAGGDATTAGLFSPTGAIVKFILVAAFLGLLYLAVNAIKGSARSGGYK